MLLGTTMLHLERTRLTSLVQHPILICSCQPPLQLVQEDLKKIFVYVNPRWRNAISHMCTEKWEGGPFLVLFEFLMLYPDIKQASSVRFVADQLMRNRNGWDISVALKQPNNLHRCLLIEVKFLKLIPNPFFFSTSSRHYLQMIS